MNHSTKKIISIWMIIIISIILAVIAFSDDLRDKLLFLSCHNFFCIAHFLFGFFAPLAVYISGAFFGYFQSEFGFYQKPPLSLKKWFLGIKFENICGWVICYISTFGFEVYYQFIAKYNSGSLIQFINSLVSTFLIIPYIFWFRKR